MRGAFFYPEPRPSPAAASPRRTDGPFGAGTGVQTCPALFSMSKEQLT
jgi:hypothetical protein